MRLLKYFLLLLVLIIIAGSVFIATQKQTFDFEISEEINITSNKVTPYFINLHNWTNWNLDLLTPNDNATNLVKTSEKITWKQNENDYFLNNKKFENDTLEQQFSLDNNSLFGNLKWYFVKKQNKTAIVLKAKGELNFKMKVIALFKGGVTSRLKKDAAAIFENVSRNLGEELQKYTIEKNGLVLKPASFYIYKEKRVVFQNRFATAEKALKELYQFSKENKISIYGKPFLMYVPDTLRGMKTIKICLPTKEAFYFAAESDILAGNHARFEAIKTTFTGDYSHLPKAEAQHYVQAKNWEKSIVTAAPFIEVLWISSLQNSYPSQWKTLLYAPVVNKKKKRYYIRKTNNNNTTETTETTPASGSIITE